MREISVLMGIEILYKCIRQLQMDGANKYHVVKRYRFMFLRGKKTTEPK